VGPSKKTNKREGRLDGKEPPQEKKVTYQSLKSKRCPGKSFSKKEERGSTLKVQGGVAN